MVIIYILIYIPVKEKKEKEKYLNNILLYFFMKKNLEAVNMIKTNALETANKEDFNLSEWADKEAVMKRWLECEENHKILQSFNVVSGEVLLDSAVGIYVKPHKIGEHLLLCKVVFDFEKGQYNPERTYLTISKRDYSLIGHIAGWLK